MAKNKQPASAAMMAMAQEMLGSPAKTCDEIEHTTVHVALLAGSRVQGWLSTLTLRFPSVDECLGGHGDAAALAADRSD